MARQYVWIVTSVGVFLAGIAIGYGIFASASQHITNQQMFNNMMQNPEFMTEMMNNQQFQDQMITQMRQNHNFTQSIIMNMMDDPQIRGQMIGHMLENQEFMEEMQMAMGGNQTSSGSQQENSNTADEAVATARQFILSKLPSLGIEIENELDLHTDMLVHMSETEFHLDYSVLDTNGGSHDGHIEVVSGRVTVANLDGKSIL